MANCGILIVRLIVILEGIDVMSKNMTPKQIDEFIGNFLATLEKHTGDFPSTAVQAVLGDPDFATEQLKLLLEWIEARSRIVTHDFIVDLNLVGKAAIDATRRTKQINDRVLETMPRATVSVGKLHFFETGRYTLIGEDEAEYSKRGLVPVDPHTLCAFNAANVEFADTYPNGTLWKDIDGNFCFVSFSRWDGERIVGVGQVNREGSAGCWFAGFSK